MVVLQLIMANVGTSEDSQAPRSSYLHFQELDEELTKMTQQNCHVEPKKRSSCLYKQKVQHLLLNRRVDSDDISKLSPETQSRLALVIILVQGTIAPIRLMVLKDLWARLYADLDNVFQKDLTIESASRFLLEREQAIATGEGSIANFYDKWFKGNWALNCDGRSVTREQDSERVAPASKAPSVVVWILILTVETSAEKLRYNY